VPISATPGFISQVHLLAASVRRYGGRLADATIHVTLGRDRPWVDIPSEYPWTSRYPIEWSWMPPEDSEATGIVGTALHRFTHDFEAPFVLMLDADTFCTGPLDELIELGRGALAGLVDHASPKAPVKVDGDWRHDDTAFWNYLYAAVGLPEPELTCQYSGWGLIDTDPALRWCPPYFNHGVLAGSRDVMGALGEVVMAELRAVDNAVKSRFKAQLAVTVALERTGSPWRPLPLRLNFPNDERFCEAYPQDAADIRTLHYLRTDQIDRKNIATSASALNAFLARPDLSSTNRLLQDRVRELREELEPELS
jgi:hypothetical protein